MTMFEDFVNQRHKDSPFIKTADFAANKAGHHATVLTKDLHTECTSVFDEVFSQFGGLMEEAEQDNKHVIAVKTALHNYLPTVDAEMARIINKLKAIEKDPYIKTKPNITTSGSSKIKEEKKQQPKRYDIKSEFGF